ncbi:hypothetical protein AVEN_79150-1 [Araneus ventricosus]|uniref:Uncharacterized protein n=1 Tax=Araneus ventricosus TaxID=182803 RepID=A0A4Y2TV94_ARAVE|nr:hypothetical protein AVEN_79150-1 [Araneus ventricosus]
MSIADTNIHEMPGTFQRVRRSMLVACVTVNVPYREAPRYNPRRRTSAANMGTTSQNHSDPRLELVLSGGKPPSPCPSNPSLPHLSSSDGGIPHSVSGEEDTDESGGPLVNHSTGKYDTDPCPTHSPNLNPL